MKMSVWAVACAAVLALCSVTAVAGPVNINTADAATLAAELTGVGPALAEAIVRDRAENGNFDSPEALTRVKGIGDRIVEMNRENIRISD
ncbi:MAG TPA: helix-hairpin-helix domain-containing protein [Gammaproteobacteria bacterium]|nr:helix-hairpin-helix domain-containing protein [Gammaproteobacteria bacterium]